MSTTTGLQLTDQPPSSTPPPPSKTSLVLGLCGVAVGLSLSLFRAWTWSYETFNAEMLGFACGGTIVPFIIAYLIAGRKSVRNFTRFGLWFGGMMILVFLITKNPAGNIEQHIANLAREAAGTKVIERQGPRVMDEMIRDMMRDMFDKRKDLERDTDQYRQALSKLYTAESFSNREAIQQILAAVQGVVAADERYAHLLESFPEYIQAKVDGSELSSNSKKDFMVGFRKSYANLQLLTTHRQTIQAEKKWADATVRLYQFAAANINNVRVHGSEIVIANDRVRSAFNKELDESRRLHENMMTLNTQLQNTQFQLLKGLGLTASDLGLSEYTQSQRTGQQQH